jgi:hypothetical protein
MNMTPIIEPTATVAGLICTVLSADPSVVDAARRVEVPYGI